MLKAMVLILSGRCKMSNERIEQILAEAQSLDLKSQALILELVNELERIRETVSSVIDIC